MSSEFGVTNYSKKFKLIFTIPVEKCQLKNISRKVLSIVDLKIDGNKNITTQIIKQQFNSKKYQFIEII